MFNKLRRYMQLNQKTRWFIAVFLFVAVFCGVLEYRLDEYVSQSQKNNLEANPEELCDVSSLFTPDPLLLWKLKPSYTAKINAAEPFVCRTNSLGMRGMEIKDSSPKNDALKILCLGDSATFGMGLEEELTYESFLKYTLESYQLDRKISVYNGGCPGYTSFQGRYFTQQIAPLIMPDIYILGFNYQDPSLTDEADLDRAGRSGPERWFNSILFNSGLYLCFKRQFFASKQVGKGDILRVSAKDYLENMRWFAQYASLNKGRTVYINMPKQKSDPSEVYQAYRDICKETAEATDSLYIDADLLFASQGQDADLFADRITLNSRGCNYLALIIADELDKKGWLKK